MNYLKIYKIVLGTFCTTGAISDIQFYRKYNKSNNLFDGDRISKIIYYGMEGAIVGGIVAHMPFMWPDYFERVYYTFTCKS